MIGKCAVVGPTTLSLLPSEVAVFLDTQSRPLPTFYRLLTKEDTQILYSAHYTRVPKRNSFTVFFKDENECLLFGQIQYFVVFAGDCKAVVKLLTSFDDPQVYFQLTFTSLNKHLFPVRCTDLIKIVPVSNIKDKCIFMNMDNNSYIARFTSQISFD